MLLILINLLMLRILIQSAAWHSLQVTLELILSIRVVGTPCPLQTVDRDQMTQHILSFKRKSVITYYILNIHQMGREQRLDI